MAAPSPGPPPTSAATSAGGSPSMVEAPPAAPTCAWTRQQEKLFENALAVHDQDAPDRWEKIAAMVTGKDAAAIKRHYDLLVEDVNSIEAGRVPLPPYSSAAVSATECMGEPAVGSGESSSAKKSGGFSVGHSPVVAVTSNGSGGNSGPGKGTPKSSDQERRKGIPWTEDEHRLFLLGLDKFGKGDWRSISRNFVISRTPTQVASHAQKYFIRLNSMNRDRRRSSIHDITSVNNGDSTQPCQGPITGQGAVGQPVTHIATSGLAGAAVYGAPVGQPIAGPVGSAVGTPVLLPPPGVAGPYVSRGPLPRPVMPGAPMAVVPVAYPLAQPVPQPIPQQPVHR